MPDFGYDTDAHGNPVPKGWQRVRLALRDRVASDREAAAIASEWQHESRFGPTASLSYIVESGCVRPFDVEHLR